MTTLWTPEQIRKTFSYYIKSQKNSKMRIVDGVSCVTAKPSKESFALQNLYDLNTINLVLLQAIADIEKGHLCIDSLTTLMTYSAPVSVIKFLQVLCARVKNHGVTGIYLLEEGVHEKELVTTLRYIVDGVIEIRDQESTGSIMHQVRFAHARGVRTNTKWLIFHKDEPLKFLTP